MISINTDLSFISDPLYDLVLGTKALVRARRCILNRVNLSARRHVPFSHLLCFFFCFFSFQRKINRWPVCAPLCLPVFHRCPVSCALKFSLLVLGSILDGDTGTFQKTYCRPKRKRKGDHDVRGITTDSGWSGVYNYLLLTQAYPWRSD